MEQAGNTDLVAALSHFFDIWGDAITAVVAVIALIQPWLLYIWKRFFRAGQINILESSTIEIGYSSFGPTIGLMGTLRAQHRDIFVRSMRVLVVKERDQSRHNFDWLFFRSHKYTVGKGDELTAEFPCSFMIMSNQPQRFNILFHDLVRQDEMTAQLTTALQSWNTYFTNPQFSGQPLASIYASFSQTPVHVTAHTNIDRLCYWEPGRYRLMVTIETELGQLTQSSYTFSLSDTDEQMLRLNTVAIMLSTFNQQNANFNFARARYNS